MLEDPWAEFPNGRLPDQGQGKGHGQTLSKENSLSDFTPPSFKEKPNEELSDSMIPQIGDSFMERNLVNPAPCVGNSESDLSANTPDESGSDPKMSDSLIPQVGDSLLRSDSTTENHEEME